MNILKPRSISHAIIGFTILIYPHMVFGGILIDGKTMILILMFTAFTAYTFYRSESSKPLLEASAVNLPLIFLAVILSASFLFAQNKPVAFEAVLLFLGYLGVYFISLDAFTDLNKQQFFVFALIIITVFLCIYGLSEYLFWKQRGTGMRLMSTFGNSNLMAGWLVMVIPLTTAVLLSKHLKKIYFPLVAASLILMTLCLLYTFARGGWISAGIGLLVVVGSHAGKNRQKKSKSILYFLIALATVLSVFLSSTELSKRFGTMVDSDLKTVSNGRLVLAKSTLEMIKNYPFTGTGPGNYSQISTVFEPPWIGRHFFAHNDYLHFIAELGIALIPLMLWLVYVFLMTGWSKAEKSLPKYKYLSIGALGSVAAILVYSFGDYNLHIPANVLLFITLSAMVLAPVKQTDQPAHH